MAEAHQYPANPRVTVLGGGTFATALATVFARNGAIVTMYIRSPEVVKSINEEHRNAKYFPDYQLLPNITATADPVEAFKDVKYILHAIPVQPSVPFLKENAQYIPPNVPIISLSKGIHLETLQFMVDIIHELLHPEQPVVVLSGPSFARELMDEQPTGMVVACANTNLAKEIQHYISGHRLRCYVTDDVLGAELGGALKNVYAIGAGIASGMGFKLNTAAMIVTRACSEMKKLSLAMGGKDSTLSGLSGIGDLMLTCFGPASRNRTVGVRLGQGESLNDILASMPEVAEGVPTASALVRLADKYHMEMPMARAVAAVLHHNDDPREAMIALMTRPLTMED